MTQASAAGYPLIRLADRPEYRAKMAAWFHEKWGIPLAAYLESMDACLTGRGATPQWYAALDGEKIIGGMGVIENDFHDRKDLSPNVCAVYVEKDYRRMGLAGRLLDFVCRDMGEKGIAALYLITNHTGFYEKYGWRFVCMARGDGEDGLSRIYVHRLPSDASQGG